MPPPPKRARTSTLNEDGDVHRKESSVVSAKPKQHDLLWFEDGNIVLATDVHLYCIHRGVLVKNSTVFKEKLELQHGEGKIVNVNCDSEVWEGKPLFRMDGDSDEDVHRLLMTLYDIRFFSAHKGTTLPVVLSLLRMSAKYDFVGIRSEVIDRLEQVYPSDLDDMVDRDVADVFDLGKDLPADYDFQLLAVAQDCNVKVLLPMLYFECATQDLKTIMNALELYKLQKRDQERLVLGYERLLKYSYEFGVKAFAPHVPCDSKVCSTSRASLYLNRFEFSDYSPPKFPVEELLERRIVVPEEQKELRASICGTCTKSTEAALDTLRTEFWGRLPDIFDMGTWDDVKNE